MKKLAKFSQIWLKMAHLAHTVTVYSYVRISLVNFVY